MEGVQNFTIYRRKGWGIVLSLFICTFSICYVLFFMSQVQWPLSIVVSRKALSRYQLIFRFLFHCKHVERQLCTAWQVHQVWLETFCFIYRWLSISWFRISHYCNSPCREFAPSIQKELPSPDQHCSVGACLNLLIAFFIISHLRQVYFNTVHCIKNAHFKMLCFLIAAHLLSFLLMF